MIDLNTPFGEKAKKRLETDEEIWLVTVGPDGTPQPRPVWFWWDGETVLIYSQAKAHKLKHLAANPKVALNLNASGEGANVVVLTGTAKVDPSAPLAHLNTAYAEKYKGLIPDIGMSPEEFSTEYGVAIRVTPETLRGF